MKDFLIETITKAGQLLVEKFEEHHEFDYKAEGKYKDYPQVVSKIDLYIQDVLVDLIKKKFPNHSIISEETKSDSFSFSDYTWVIDPIDGSTHYLRGIPSFSVSVAIFHEAEVFLGAVYAPIYQNLFLAEKGKGAFHNQKSIKVSTVDSLSKALVTTSVYQSYKIRGIEQSFQSVIKEIKNLRMFASSALDMCWVASGKLDARIFANTEIWDHAAAALIVEEAGGKITDWQGKKWTYKTDRMLVSNGLIHDEILKILND